MCDDLTAHEEEAALARKGIGRRDFAALSAAAVIAACTAGDGEAKTKRALTERSVTFPTPDGTADGFFVHPAKGKHPAVLLWPDIAGLREAYQVMARRLAEAGYAVLVLNHYYRNAPAPIMKSMAEWRTPEGQERLKPMIAAINPEATMRDAKAAIAWLDAQKAVDRKRGVGTQGYCMGGPLVFKTCAAINNRVGAGATFHGGGLVTDKPDSPHLLIPKMKTHMLIAIASNDDAKQPDAKDKLKAAFASAKIPAEVEVYAGTLHGWCVRDMPLSAGKPIYNQPDAERAWGRLLNLYKTSLT